MPQRKSQTKEAKNVKKPSVKKSGKKEQLKSDANAPVSTSKAKKHNSKKGLLSRTSQDALSKKESKEKQSEEKSMPVATEPKVKKRGVKKPSRGAEKSGSLMLFTKKPRVPDDSSIMHLSQPKAFATTRPALGNSQFLEIATKKGLIHDSYTKLVIHNQELSDLFDELTDTITIEIEK